MAWDDTKSKGDIVKSADWNAMVTDQKSRIASLGKTITPKGDGVIGDAIETLTGNDATPDVSGSNVFKLANTGATTITNFINGRVGQSITLLFDNGNTTIQSNGSVKLQSGEDFTGAQYDSMHLVKWDATTWVQVGPPWIINP